MMHTVIGTAGHIDHGKTSIVKALTGVDTDRLPEEKERGITIDLGFAFLGDHTTIIDVPGHERFVKTMVAGVTSIDIALLVIAADDGVMPQSKEHLDILQLLGVQYGIIALNKIDLVDSEWADLLEDELRAFTKGSFLENSPIIRVSAETRQGIEELADQLNKFKVSENNSKKSGPFRMPVDRFFSIKGFGPVATGTVLCGKIQTGNNLDVLPSGLSARVRNLQVHGKKVNVVSAGNRAAINMVGVNLDEVKRGDVLSESGIFKTTQLLDAQLAILESSPVELFQRARVRLHVGTAEVLARIQILGRDNLLPGDNGWVQLRLESPISVAWGDRFVIRRYSPALTIGGGVVLDPRPPKRRRVDYHEIDHLMDLDSNCVTNAVKGLIASSKYCLWNQNEFSSALAQNLDEIKLCLLDLESKGYVLLERKEPYLIAIKAEDAEAIKNKLIKQLEEYHSTFPLRIGAHRQEIRQKIVPHIEDELLDWMLGELEEEQKIESGEYGIRMVGFEIVFSKEDTDFANKIEELVKSADWSSLLDADALSLELEVSIKPLQSMITALKHLGTIISISDGLLVHVEKLVLARTALLSHFENNREISVATFRDILNGNRRIALALLVQFDDENITKRSGDVRIRANLNS